MGEKWMAGGLRGVGVVEVELVEGMEMVVVVGEEGAKPVMRLVMRGAGMKLEEVGRDTVAVGAGVAVEETGGKVCVFEVVKVEPGTGDWRGPVMVRLPAGFEAALPARMGASALRETWETVPRRVETSVASFIVMACIWLRELDSVE